MLLKVALHAHTVRSDGTLTPNELLRRYAEHGFDVVAITDHDMELTEEELARLTVPDGLLVLRGSEVSYQQLYWQHVGHIWGETKLLRILNHPRRYGMTAEQVARAVKEHRFDAFEITNHGVYCPQYESLLLPRVATDDCHYPEMMNRAWMLVEVKERSGDAVIDAILRGDADVVIRDGPKPAPRQA
ncbi:MAG: PHP domain-containing protein [Chloroflexota bacterium]|nr:PHP domain-containing protein [Dehalococcoidia bacterium]MDW8253211.1 PHP domain-containing protein [Chloroflexota bacterium]